MLKVRVLDEHIANQIAAGEVVERPASVVKELVENAIDANSTRIDIIVEEAGLSSIRVKDNGTGIQPEDMKTAFARHATSKIVQGRDLFHITTLGFRGEALPSIAAVSKVEMVSCHNQDGKGKKITIEGGKLLSEQYTAAPRGTDIIVKQLFYNTPARLKYMKTVQTELSNICEVIYRMALSHPQISFTFHHHDHPLLKTLGNGQLLQVVAAIYGTTAAKAMLPLESDSLDYRIQGLISRPEWTRANRHGISTIVNGRYIRSYSLNQAVIKAYHTLVPIHRYPLIVMHLHMHPSLVDVNVHPAKLEVRFSKEVELLELVEKQIHSVLSHQVLIPQPERLTSSKTSKPSMIQQTSLIYSTSTGRKGSALEVNEQPTLSYDSPQTKQMEHASVQIPPFPELHYVGQHHGTYIIAQNEDGLYLIDQHAAHERVNYEFYYEKFANHRAAFQQLLLPLTLEFTPHEAEKLQSRLHWLEQAGVYVDYFGGQTFRVHAYPDWFQSTNARHIVEEMCQWVIHEKKIDPGKFREKSAILCACKASIKANQKISEREAKQLLGQLALCKQPYTCPHGRPIIVSFSTYELQKWFKRIM